MTHDWNVAERVFHDKYLWMEVAKWDLDVYRALSKITRADQSDTLAYRKQLVMGMLKVYMNDEQWRCRFIITSMGSITACSNGGICYAAGTGVRDGIMANPFGPVHYHLCSQTQTMIFSSGVKMLRELDYTWSVWYGDFRTFKASNKGRNDKIDEMLTVYRDNPFANFWPVPEIMKLRA